MADISYRRVLVATDGSADASLAADHAIAVAKAFHAALTVVSVIDIYAFMDPQVAAVGVEILDREREFLRDAVNAIAARARQAGVENVEASVLEGFPRNALVETISTSHSDLVV